MSIEEMTEDQARLDEREVRLLRPAEGAVAQAPAWPDFTYRHHWGPLRGLAELTLTTDWISKRSNVFVSASEHDDLATLEDPLPTPFLGSAKYTVLNVVPFNGGVRVRLNVEWGNPLHVQLSYLVVNP